MLEIFHKMFIQLTTVLEGWVLSNWEGVSVGLVTNGLYAILCITALVVLRYVWLIFNRLLPLSSKEFDLLDGISNKFPPQAIRHTRDGLLVAGTCKVDKGNTKDYLKATTKLRRKKAVVLTGSDDFFQAIYSITPYGHKRLKRAIIFRKIPEVLNKENLKKTRKEQKTESDF